MLARSTDDWGNGVLSDELKQRIQATYRRFLADNDLKPRYAQRHMIAHIARVLAQAEDDNPQQREQGEHLCLLEAGTGTGKTMAYLIGALAVARQQNKSLVLSTATVALQQQLLSKDLPQMAALEDEPLNYQLAKGRGRYLCILQVEKLLNGQQDLNQMALYEDEASQRLDGSVIVFYQQLLDRFAAGQWDGERDHLAEEIDDSQWLPLTSDHTRCTNRRCGHFSSCPFFRAREALDDADVIVANHDLVLADLALGGGAILPDPAESIYVFDEAHHLAVKAINHFAYSMRVRSSQRWLNSASKQLKQLQQACPDDSAVQRHCTALISAFENLSQPFDTLYQQAQQLFAADSLRANSRYRFVGGVVPAELAQLSKHISQTAEQCAGKAEQLVELLKQALDEGLAGIKLDDAQTWYPRIGQLWMRLQSIYWLSASFAHPDQPGKPPTARWISVHETNDGLDFECHSSPVSAASTLQQHLWPHCFAAVMTSATLTALGRFDRIIADLGVPQQLFCARLPSPFDYANAALLCVPAMSADPADPQAHTAAVSDYLNQHLSDATAALVLFSSWKQMFTVLESTLASIRAKVLAQGELSKNEIIHRHCQRIDAGEPSVIFGLASFAEGVDLPGQYLTEVIITKLPFGVPDDPVDATMAEWITQRGGNAFMEWTVPEASIRLTQAAGRLLRTEQDRGQVVLLDRRVVTRRYGRQLLDALPPFKRAISD